MLPKRRQEIPLLHEYGCVLCQRYHARELGPELYEAHLWHQSKHGCRERVATVPEMFALEMRRENAE